MRRLIKYISWTALIISLLFWNQSYLMKSFFWLSIGGIVFTTLWWMRDLTTFRLKLPYTITIKEEK